MYEVYFDHGGRIVAPLGRKETLVVGLKEDRGTTSSAGSDLVATVCLRSSSESRSWIRCRGKTSSASQPGVCVSASQPAQPGEPETAAPDEPGEPAQPETRTKL